MQTPGGSGRDLARQAPALRAPKRTREKDSGTCSIIVLNNDQEAKEVRVRIGFTGTRHEMEQRQFENLSDFLQEINVLEFHYGDCVGADEDAVALIRVFHPEATVVMHPPKDGSRRAYTQADVVRPERDYLERNHNIVDACELLLAAPHTRDEVLRSGTWATIRYARKVGRDVQLFLPQKRTKEHP